MRSAGTIESGRQVGAHDHVCWAHADADEFRTRALEFLADGIDRGHRIAYVGPSSTDELREDLMTLDGADELLERGGASVVSLHAMYRDGTVIGPTAQVRTYTAATRQALADGYRGLRVAAEATMLVRTVAQREAFVRYEHLMDRAMRTVPFSAMCGYDRGVIGEEAVAELACVHPLVTPETTRFQLYAPERVDLAVAGEIDVENVDAFALALDRTSDVIAGDALVLDASELGFVDHRGMLALDRLDRPVLLQDAPRVALRLADLLDLTDVHARART